MEHERCYIYAPSEADGPPPKRQRISEAENNSQVQERMQLFRTLWVQQEERIESTLEEADRATQEKIVDFISNSQTNDHQCIPTGLVIAGPSIASHGSFFERLGRKIRDDTQCAYHILTSSESPNLKTLLKNLIKKATSHVEDDDDDDLGLSSTSSRKGPKVLDFDLQHIQEWQNRNQAANIVVAIQDSEAFDSRVLIETIDLFYSWLDRLPFVLLFGIATSAESFEDRLSGRCLRYLEGQKFDVVQSDEIVEKLVKATIASADVPFRIGPNIVRRMLDRQKDHVQNTQDFSDGLKYAFMSHFYASHPSILLKEGITFEDVSPDVFEAVRNLPSFRRAVESMLDVRRIQEARRMLDSNQYLFESVKKGLDSGKTALNDVSTAATVLSHTRDFLQMSPSLRLSSIWIRAASAELEGSPPLRETMLSIKKIPSDKLTQLLDSLQEFDQHFTFDLVIFRDRLKKLVRSNDSSTPLRSQHDVRNESLRTTVVAQKVLLSKHKAALSEQDKAYSELVSEFHDELDSYFSATFINPQDLFLSELLVYDLKSPHTEVFQPRPRFAIERALGTPHDYLGCDCCGLESDQAGEGALSATQPETAILYQLYLESGSLINVSDLWSAFNAIIGEEDADSQANTMALFQRALAELKYLGFVKPTRKKTDHVAKLMWKGL